VTDAQDKDAKINFLTKMVDLVSLMIGERCDVKSSKIVAGLEADKTNIFL
jgi:TRAF3-interacting protein 1